MDFKYEGTIISLIEEAMRTVKTRPLTLGGISASGGGAGGPPGGFSGWLPQTRVAYDFSELEDDTTPDPLTSGTLLDNLNRIRYRIGVLETSSGSSFSGSFTDLEDVPDSYVGQAGYVVMVNQTETGLEFSPFSGAGTGDVTGPESSTANHIAVFGGTTGKVIADGGETIITRWTDIFRFGFVTGYDGAQETTISFDGTNTFTLAPSDSTWTYYRNGSRYTITGSKTVDLAVSPPATKGLYYIYIDATDGTLTSSTSPWTLEDTKVPVSTIAWDNSATPKYWLQDERHSASIDRRFHWEHHFSDGTELITAPTISGYSVAPSSPSDTDNTFGIGESVLADEDLKHTLAELSDPNGTSTDYVVFYRTASSTWTWKASAVPYSYTTDSYIDWDNAGTLQAAPNAKYVNSWLLCTNYSGAARFAIIPDQTYYSTLAEAQAALFSSLTKTGLPIAEFVAVRLLTWQTNSSYTTKGKCRLAATPKTITVSASGATADTYTRVTSLATDDSSKITGDITLMEGTNVSIIQSGNSFYFTATTSGGGHTIEDDGSPVTQRNNLNFTGPGVTLTDDAVNDATVVTISGGGSGTVDILQIQIFS